MWVNRYRCSFFLHLTLVFGMALLLSCQPSNKSSSTNGPPTTGSTLDRVTKAGILNVSYIIYPPTVIKDPNTGKLSGHFVDAARFMAEVMGVEVRFHEAEWSTFAASLQSGQVDLSIAATYRTIPRATAVAFTRPIMYVGSSAIIRKGDSRFNAIDDFDKPGITVAVAQGDGTAEYVREHFKRATVRVLSTSNLSLPLSEVAAGRVDAGLVDAWTTAQFARENNGVVDLFAGRPFELIGVGWAVRHGDLEWLNFINTALDYLESTGRMAKWEAQYNAHWLRPNIQYSAD